MICEKSLRQALPVLCLLLFFSAGATLSAQPTQTPEPPSSPPSAEPSTPPSLPTDTAPGPSLSELWAQLKSELIASDADWQRVSSLLDALQIEADGLRSSLTLSTALLEQSEAARETERQVLLDTIAARDLAQRKATAWRTIGLSAGSVAIISMAVIIVQAITGN
jgi:hypothetical protein